MHVVKYSLSSQSYIRVNLKLMIVDSWFTQNISLFLHSLLSLSLFNASLSFSMPDKNF